MTISRRSFISSAAALAASTQFGVTWAWSAQATDQRLIVVFLRGGMDALNFLAPADDKNYQAARPASLRVGTAGAERGLAIGGIADGGDLLLHPQASGIAKLWKDQKLAFIPASGLMNGTRSHFQAMDLIERGIANEGGSPPRDGWLTRAALAIGNHEPGSVMSIGGAMPQSLSLCEDALPATEVWDLDWAPSQNFREALFDIHSGANALDSASRQALNATQRLSLKVERNAKNEPYLRDVPKGVSYPDHDFGRNLNFLAEMLRISPDIGIATADLDGWDMHDNQPDKFKDQVGILSQSLAAFQLHLEVISRPATIVVMSEFGRRVKANDSRGTDHGHGGVMMVLGNGVNGGQNFGSWPGLANEQLDEGADLAVTTDFRDVLATVLRGQGASAAIAGAFPGYSPKFIDGLMWV